MMKLQKNTTSSCYSLVLDSVIRNERKKLTWCYCSYVYFMSYFLHVQWDHEWPLDVSVISLQLGVAQLARIDGTCKTHVHLLAIKRRSIRRSPRQWNSRRHFSHGRAAAKRSRRAFNTWDLQNLTHLEKKNLRNLWTQIPQFMALDVPASPWQKHQNIKIWIDLENTTQKNKKDVSSPARSNWNKAPLKMGVAKNRA